MKKKQLASNWRSQFSGRSLQKLFSFVCVHCAVCWLFGFYNHFPSHWLSIRFSIRPAMVAAAPTTPHIRNIESKQSKRLAILPCAIYIARHFSLKYTREFANRHKYLRVQKNKTKTNQSYSTHTRNDLLLLVVRAIVCYICPSNVHCSLVFTRFLYLFSMCFEHFYLVLFPVHGR